MCVSEDCVSCHLQLDVLPVLTLVQLDELVFGNASAADRTNILTRVFDFLLQNASKNTVDSFLRSLQTQARKVSNATF